MVPLKSIMVIFLIIQHVMGQDDYLWCYECGTGVPGEPDCLVFSLSSSWKLYWRKCPADSVCVKTLPADDMDDDIRAVRGCTPKDSLAGTPHQDGCWTHESTSTILCYCSTNLCNSATTIRFVMSYSAIAALSTIFIYANYIS